MSATDQEHEAAAATTEDIKTDDVVPTKILVRSVSMATGKEILLANGYTSPVKAEGNQSLDALSPSSEHSAASFDSSPSIAAIERALSNAPGVTTERPDFGDDVKSVSPLSSMASTPVSTPASTSVPPQPRSTPVLERSRTASELLTMRQKEFQSARGANDKTYSNSTAPSFEVESVLLPADAITEVEVEKTMHTVFAVEVRLHGGLQWIIKKRYSDFRELHERLKRTNASVKQLHFPKRHVFRNRHQSVIEQRRSELEKYINEVLEIRPLIRLPLFNFLEVYVHMESYERKLQRHKKELESERMKNLLDSHTLEDLSAAFKRLCSSKFVYHSSAPADSTNTSEATSSSGGTTVTNSSTAPASNSSATGGPTSPGATSPIKETPTPKRKASEEKQVTGANGTSVMPTPTAGSLIYLSRASFRRDVLGVFPDIPSSFAMRFMKAVSDRQGADINMDEFLRAVAILKCGTMDDKLRFVFNMCDLDHTGKVQSTGLSNFLVSLHGRQVLDRLEYRHILNEGFEQGRARLDAESFAKIMVELEVTDLLVDWMNPFIEVLCETPDPQLLESQEEFNPAVQQKILASETQFSVKEVSTLQDAFNNYRVSSGGDTVDLEPLSSDFPLEMTDERFHRVFSSFGPRANGRDIDVFSFINVLAIACRGTNEEKANFAFKLFATIKDGTLISRDDLFAMFRLDLAQNPDLEELVNEFIDKYKIRSMSTKSLTASESILAPDSGAQTPSVSGSQLGRFVDSVMRECGQMRQIPGEDVVSALTLTREEFMAWAERQNYEMAALRIMREVVFVDLGLVPGSKEEELLVAKGCYKPYDPTTLVEDDTWYIIEKKWFDHWCKYVNLSTADTLSTASATSSTSSISELPGKTANGTKSAPHSNSNANNKEPPIVDADGNYVRPKCINNFVLLTGDRRDILKGGDEIKLGKHFVIIPEQLWMGLKLWYGGGPEIQRKVITKSNGSAIIDIWEEEKKKKAKKQNGDDDDDQGSASEEERSKRAQSLALPRRMRSGGSVGLTNLGNTCYMNSALQCLTNTQLLAEYFLSGMYLDDINRTSTLGLQGKLAEVYGKLAEDMWCAKQKAISPRNFKKTIAKFNEAFRGSDQQDSQELLAFLLSGLSEDLNRIQDKPYVEQPDSDGRFDSDLADEWWRNHLRREVSIIVALFTGQYKSLLTCSECGFKSARFEPFTFLQLPLPEPTHSTVTLLLVLSNGMAPMKVSVRLGISATVFDLKHELMKLCHSDFDLPHITETDIKLCEYTGSMILSFKADNRRIGQIRSIERLIAFQLEPLSAETIKATRNRRPSYVPPTTASIRIEEMEAEKAEQAKFYDSLVKGTLVEVRMRTQSQDYIPGVVVECPTASEAGESDREDEHDEDKSHRDLEQKLITVRLQRSDEEVQVTFGRMRPRQARLLYIPLLSRKLNYSALYFKNPFRPAPFGIPNLVRFCPELTTGYDLYKLVWLRVQRYVKGSEPTPWSKDEFESLSEHEVWSNRIDNVFKGLTSTCGFLLRRVENKGLTDSRSGWLTRSFGQIIPCTEEPLDIMEEEAIAIDWDLEIFQDRVNLEKMRQVESHSSVEKNEAIDKGPVPLKTCLDAFTSEEKISEGYCSSCRKHLEMTKKMEIWRLPPVMVIHLKRFQYTQTYRRKLGSLVEFPVHDLELASTVAPHVEVPERYPVKRSREESVKKVKEEEVTVEAEPEAAVKDESEGETDATKAATVADSDGSATADSSSSSPAETKPPIQNRIRRGYTNTNLEQSRCLETKYDLYGVVNHQGALGGGHYTAYAKNFLDDQWYFYDDERVRVVEESKVVSPSAYLLFYVRSDMEGVLVKDLYPQNSNKKITDEDIDRFVEEDDRRCRIM
ncbi:hypothetical protein Poli38472_003662 [Pythium oligandrum]|uniref:ubiquitinyl hydrolase 1 n=1 Tax=Pythium oligandrum TaxID=41045 RepID=A0A8K1FNI4_PYTOL|nr:hypothetical protein Poli38472_003662 [Pythium oligandrum]|eukprot:TMW65897.1 hypothetical protein Poli38472_003662 [Pythium oligandrum]